MASRAWTIVEDSLYSTLSLQYPPQIIAVAALYLGAQHLKDAAATSADHITGGASELKQIADSYQVPELTDIALEPYSCSRQFVAGK